MAAAQALNTPELLSLILQYYGEEYYDEHIKGRKRSTRTNLAKFARVNHLWSDTATNVLWSYEEWGPTFANLSRIEASRRQIYASKLVSIKIGQSETTQTPDTTALSFPRAKRLDRLAIGGENGFPATSVKQYLRPSIESILLLVMGDSFNKELMTVLNSQCPRLRSLKLVTRDEDHVSITPRDFGESFPKQSLESLYLDILPPLITKELFVTLGGMKSLSNLSITGTLSLRQIPESFRGEAVWGFRKPGPS
jgi:hypothetical protein